MPFPNSLDRLRPPRASERGETNERTRQFRANQTEAEAALWALLRNRKLIGMKFRRQVPIGRYVADFYCHDRRLVVELDGPVHSDPATPGLINKIPPLPGVGREDGRGG